MSSNSLRIVIADNESIIRMDLRELLMEAGHEVVAEAGDGRQAIDLARRHRPDLVIMDIKMPEMDGIETLRHLAELPLPSSTPVYLMAPPYCAEELQNQTMQQNIEMES